MGAEDLLDALPPQAWNSLRSRHCLEQCPEPGLVGCGHELEHLGKEAMELLAEAVRQPGELIPQVVVHPRVLAQLDDDGIIEPDPAKGRLICAKRSSQDERVPTVVLRPRHGVPVAEAIELLRVERVHVAAPLHERFHNQRPAGPRLPRPHAPDGHPPG